MVIGKYIALRLMLTYIMKEVNLCVYCGSDRNGKGSKEFGYVFMKRGRQVFASPLLARCYSCEKKHFFLAFSCTFR